MANQNSTQKNNLANSARELARRSAASVKGVAYMSAIKKRPGESNVLPIIPKAANDNKTLNTNSPEINKLLDTSKENLENTLPKGVADILEGKNKNNEEKEIENKEKISYEEWLAHNQREEEEQQLIMSAANDNEAQEEEEYLERVIANLAAHKKPIILTIDEARELQNAKFETKFPKLWLSVSAFLDYLDVIQNGINLALGVILLPVAILLAIVLAFVRSFLWIVSFILYMHYMKTASPVSTKVSMFRRQRARYFFRKVWAPFLTKLFPGASAIPARSYMVIRIWKEEKKRTELLRKAFEESR